MRPVLFLISYAAFAMIAFCSCKEYEEISSEAPLSLQVSATSENYAGGETIQLHYTLVNRSEKKIALLKPVYNIYQNGHCNTLQIQWNDSLGRKVEKNILPGYDISPPYALPTTEVKTILPGDSLTGSIKLPFGQEGQPGSWGGWIHDYSLYSEQGVQKNDTLPQGKYTLVLKYSCDPDYSCGDKKQKSWTGNISSAPVIFHVKN